MSIVLLFTKLCIIKDFILLLKQFQSAFQGEKQRIVHNFQEELQNKDETINR